MPGFGEALGSVTGTAKNYIKNFKSLKNGVLPHATVSENKRSQRREGRILYDSTDANCLKQANRHRQKAN